MSSSSVPEVLLRRGLWPLLTHLACGRCNASLRRGLWPLLAHLACGRCNASLRRGLWPLLAHLACGRCHASLRRGLWPLLAHLACGRCNASLRRGLWPLLAHLACRRCHGAPDSNDANLNGKFCACGESWSRRCPPWSSQTWRLLAPAGRHTRDLAAPHTRDTAARACMLRIALDATRRNSMRRAPRTFSCMDAGTVALGTTTGSRTLLLEPWSLEHAAQGSSCDSPK
jgi:hypothetical protein